MDREPTVIGVATDVDYSMTHKRDRLTVWSGEYFGTLEATALSLPNDAGYMVTMYSGGKIRVVCPVGRTDDNYQGIDKAISDAVNAYYAERYAR